MAVFNNRIGNDTFRGTDDEYDQVDYDGALNDYNFVLNGDGTVTASHPTDGVDRLISIEGMWFSGEQEWYSMEDAIRLTSSGGGGNSTTGTVGNDVLIGNAQDNIFYGNRGNDLMNGNGGATNQANFDGGLVEFTITRNTNGDVLMSHPTWGEDVLIDIDRLLFLRDGTSYTVEAAIQATRNLPAFRLDADNVINGTPGSDLMNATNAGQAFYGGTGNDVFNGGRGFDQVNFDGSLSEYTVTQIQGGYMFEHPIWGVDILRNIEGLWMSGEAVWYPVVAATFGF